jgi:hypothetical protein
MTPLLDTPLVHRLNLGRRNLVVHLGIAPFLTKMLALQKLPSAAWLASDGLKRTASHIFSGGS